MGRYLIAHSSLNLAEAVNAEVITAGFPIRWTWNSQGVRYILPFTVSEHWNNCIPVSSARNMDAIPSGLFGLWTGPRAGPSCRSFFCSPWPKKAMQRYPCSFCSWRGFPVFRFSPFSWSHSCFLNFHSHLVFSLSLKSDLYVVYNHTCKGYKLPKIATRIDP
jgi:hypothetical protein